MPFTFPTSGGIAVGFACLVVIIPSDNSTPFFSGKPLLSLLSGSMGLGGLTPTLDPTMNL